MDTKRSLSDDIGGTVVEHSVHSNKSDIIDLGLWWCRRTDWQL